MSQRTKSVWVGECGKEVGGGCRSRRMRLWDGWSVERRVAVERPMPEEEPVIRIVLGDVEREVREEGVGVKRDILGRVGRWWWWEMDGCRTYKDETSFKWLET